MRMMFYLLFTISIILQLNIFYFLRIISTNRTSSTEKNIRYVYGNKANQTNCRGSDISLTLNIDISISHLYIQINKLPKIPGAHRTIRIKRVIKIRKVKNSG